MDGSGYRPYYEEPHDHDVAGDDKRPLILLVVLVLLAAGTLFSIHREKVRLFSNCFFGSGDTCEALRAPPLPGSAQQPRDY